MFHPEPAPQLLLLDEPTNNLDLATIANLEQSLLACEEALVLVSDDEAFLQAIGLTRRIDLVDGRLVERITGGVGKSLLASLLLSLLEDRRATTEFGVLATIS